METDELLFGMKVHRIKWGRRICEARSHSRCDSRQSKLVLKQNTELKTKQDFKKQMVQKYLSQFAFLVNERIVARADTLKLISIISRRDHFLTPTIETDTSNKYQKMKPVAPISLQRFLDRGKQRRTSDTGLTDTLI